MVEEEEILGIQPNGPGGAQEGTSESSQCDEQDADVSIVLESPAAEQHLEWKIRALQQTVTASSSCTLRRRASDSLEPHHGGPRTQETRMLSCEIPNERLAKELVWKEFVLEPALDGQ